MATDPHWLEEMPIRPYQIGDMVNSDKMHTAGLYPAREKFIEKSVSSTSADANVLEWCKPKNPSVNSNNGKDLRHN